MTTFFVRGFIVDCYSWDIRETKPRQDSIFVISEEVDRYKEKLIEDGYATEHPQLYWRFHDGVFRTMYLRSKIAKTYVYKDGKVIFWSHPIPIQRMFSNEVLNMSDCLITESSADNNQ